MKTRSARLDAIRGWALVSMIAYHASWDLVYLFGLDWPWYHSFGAHVWQQSICWTFLLLSGFCWSLGRRQLRRGLTVFLCGAAITGVTWAFMPSNLVFWGVLSLLGASSMLLVPLEPLLRRVPARLGLCVSFAAFLILRDVHSGWLGFEGLRILPLPAGLYRNLFTACLGFPPDGFFSTDYFPLLPWFFLFLTGWFLYRLKPEDVQEGRARPLVSFLGRHSLLVYMLHQPAVYGILRLMFH